MNSSLHLRPIATGDQAFLFETFVSTRPDILAATHLTEDQRDELMRSQFHAQQLHYKTHFPNADFGIIQYGNTPIGRLYLNRDEREMLIVELSILPDYRSQGIGSTLVQAVLKEAKMTQRTVRIHVEKGSPAIDFYQRLGFEQIGEKPLHYEMQWTFLSTPKIISDRS